MNPDKVAASYPSVKENTGSSGEECVGQILRSLGGERPFMVSTDFDPPKEEGNFLGKLHALGMNLLQALRARIDRLTSQIPSNLAWIFTAFRRLRTPRIPILSALCLFFLAIALFLWIARAHDRSYQQSLTHTIQKLESEKQTWAARERTFNDQKKEFEAKVEGLNKSVFDLSSELILVKASSEKNLTDKAAREAEILSLNAEIEKHKAYGEEADQRLAGANSEYGTLKQKFLELSSRKKKMDGEMKKFLQDLAEDEKAVSLGTSVVKG